MGQQQQQQQTAVAGNSALRRTIFALLVAALMVAMFAMTTAPAFAKGPGTGTCIHNDSIILGSHAEAAKVCNRI